MHLTVLADQFCNSVEGRLTVYGDGYIWAQVTILEEAILDSREAPLQLIKDGAYRPPRHTHLRHTTSQGLQHRGKEDDSHTWKSLLEQLTQHKAWRHRRMRHAFACSSVNGIGK